MHSSFIHTLSGKIYINNIEISKEAMEIYDKNYKLPEGVKDIQYTKDSHIGEGYHYRTIDNRTTQSEYPWPEGDSYIANCAGIIAIQTTLDTESAELEMLIQSVITSYADKRKKEYPSIDDLVVALWENIVEGKSSSINSIQTKRLHIKNKYPQQPTH